MKPIRRREFLVTGAGLGACLGLLPRRVFPQEDRAPDRDAPDRDTTDLMTEGVDRAVQRGLAFLGRRQITRGRGTGSFGTSGYSGGVAVCGLAGLAFMAAGNPPGQGTYGKHVDRCIQYLLENTNPQGYIAAPGGGQDRMYGHGFATLFLAEAYGMSMHRDVDSQLGKKLRSAVKLIVDTQNHEGGWRYQPVKSDADLSITICQIMALRAARDAGIHVPEDTRTRCIDYVRKSQNPDGSFRYQLGSGRGGSFALTAAGIVALNSAGVYSGPEIDRALSRLMTYLPTGSPDGPYYFYAQYYAAQAAWHAGGEVWSKWFRAIRDTLLRNHRPDGSWIDSTAGAEFGTAVACIILQLPNNYLPIFAEP